MQRISELAASDAAVSVELVFVDDGSPDRCAAIVESKLGELPVRAQLIRLSRNFGSFAAISAGLAHSSGDYCAAIAADLQEPPELVLEFLKKMRSGECEIVFGRRSGRDDPALGRLASNTFWGLYRWLVNPDIPPGGVDIFGCTRKVRDQVCSMKEVETSLPALLFWVGYRRAFVSYHRRQRAAGSSAWTLRKKLRYLVNSVFSFTDLPMKALLGVGAGGMALAVLGAITVLVAKSQGNITVPGYTATVLTIFFFGGLTSAGLGIVGEYLWMCLQNTRQRPLYIVESRIIKGDQVMDARFTDEPGSQPDPQPPRSESATPNPGA